MTLMERDLTPDTISEKCCSFSCSGLNPSISTKMDKFTVNMFLETYIWYNLFHLQYPYIKVPWFCNIYLRLVKWSWLMENTEHIQKPKWFILDTNTVSSNFSLGSLSCSEFNECWIDQSCVIVSSAVPVEEFVSKYLKNTSEQHGYL